MSVEHEAVFGIGCQVFGDEDELDEIFEDTGYDFKTIGNAWSMDSKPNKCYVFIKDPFTFGYDITISVDILEEYLTSKGIKHSKVNIFGGLDVH